MKKTALYQKHVDLGAKIVPFAGYEMPLQYSSITDEHKAVRKSVGMFDVSHMGEFIIKGKEATELIQYVTSNDVSKLEIGQAQYTCLPTPEGGIVDDLIVYRLDEDKCSEGEKAYMLVVNASNMEKDWKWIESHNSFDAKMTNISTQSSLIALQGPNAQATLQKLTSKNLDDIAFYHFDKGTVADIDNVLISGTGYTGSGGFELYVRDEDAATLWDALMDAGEEYHIQPCGLGARDTLRLEMGFCLYGNELGDSTNTIEAGLSWITKFTEDDFIGKEYLRKVKEEKPSRRLVAFVMDDRRVPRNGHEIYNDEQRKIGEVTSGTMSPCLGVPIGMGYVETGSHQSGKDVHIKFGKKYKIGKIVKPPFYKGECDN